MGWGRCGTDSRGRPIGYYYAATCDEPGCSARIDRGLGYACGGMHGASDVFCEGYFCGDHLVLVDRDLDPQIISGQMCRRCARRLWYRHRPRNSSGRFVREECCA